MIRLAIAATLLLVLTGVAVPVAAPAADVVVREEKGIYRVSAEFAVAAAPVTALRVLSDYDRIPEFAPGVKRSVVKERQGHRALVEQEAVSRVLLFRKRVHLILAIEEIGDAIAFRDTCGQSFDSYEGSWRVLPSAEGAIIVYALSAKPAFDVPQFVLTRVLKKDSADMIANLRREIERR